MEKKEIIALLLKNINVEGLVADLLDDVIDKALQKVVEDSSNPYDDMAKAALYPLLSAAAKDAIKDLMAKVVAE